MIHGCFQNISMEVQGCFKDKLSMLQDGYATLQGMDISLLPQREKIHNFHNYAPILIKRVTFFL